MSELAFTFCPCKSRRFTHSTGKWAEREDLDYERSIWFELGASQPFCPGCGARLNADGTVTPFATDQERANARRFEALEDALDIEVSVSLAKKAGGDVALRPFDGGAIFSRTLADAVDAYRAAHPEGDGQ